MAGTLGAYLPFTRSVTEDLSGKEWTVTGNPQIVNRPDFSVPVAKFEANEYMTLNNLTVGGNNHWLMDFWIYIPQTSSDSLVINIGGDDWSFTSLQVLSSGKLRLWYNHKDDLTGNMGYYKDTKEIFFNKWINVKFIYSEIYENSRPRNVDLFISDGTRWLVNSLNQTSAMDYDTTKIGRLKLVGSTQMFISQFRFYTRSDTFYMKDFMPNPPTGNIYLPTRQSFAWNEFQVHDTINFDYSDNINYTTYNKSTQWHYKNIGTADGLLVSGTSLTNVSPLKSVTSKAFYQTNKQKCFDTQASKEIYMLFDVYFDGTNRWRAYEESSTNGATGITAQTSGILNIVSNGTIVGASIPLTINKLETYLLHMRSDATNGYIDVYRKSKLKNIGNKINFPFTDETGIADIFNNDWVFDNITLSNNKAWFDNSYLQLSNFNLGATDFTIRGSFSISSDYANDRTSRILQIATSGNALLSIRWSKNNDIYTANLWVNTSSPDLAADSGETIVLSDTTEQQVKFEILYHYDVSTITVYVNDKYIYELPVPVYKRLDCIVAIGNNVQKSQALKGTIDYIEIYDNIATRDINPVTENIYTRLHTYIGNVNNGDDFSNLELQSDGSGTIFSNIVISNQQVYDYDRWTGNYNDIQRTLTNETWVKEKCLKAGLPLNITKSINISWTATGNVSTSSDIKKEGSSSIHLPNGAYLVANDIINLNTNKWTFDCWAYLVSSSDDNGYFALSARTDGDRYGIIVSNDGIWVADVESGWQAKNKSITFPSVKNQWVHLAIVKNGQKVTFYQNGTSVWSFQTTKLDNSGKFILGGNNYGYNTDIYFDQVRFVKDTALWTENFIPPTIEDYETYQNSLLSGSLDSTLNVLFPFDQIILLSFTGQNDSYAKLPLSVLPGATTFTIEVKFSTTFTASYTDNYSWKTIIGCNIPQFWKDDFGLCINNGKLCFWAEPITGGSDSSKNTTSDAIVNDGRIHTAAVVSSNGAIDLYCDGQHVAHTDNVNAKITSTYQIGIASNINNPDSSLQMDFYEARLWNVARTQDQIFADIDGTETGLQGWYKPSQNSLLDYSGNNRHATIYNASYGLTDALKSKTLDSELKDLTGNIWTISGTAPTITTINELNGKATQFGQGYIYTNPPTLKSNNFTIDFWEYIPSTVNGLTAQMVAIDGTDGTGTQCLDIGYDNGATVPSFWLGKGASSGWKYSNKIIGTKIRDKWVHRAVVRYNDKIYAFENGQLYTSFDIEPDMYIDITGSSLFVGGFKRASRLFPGMLSEMRIHVGTALWTTNFTPPTQEDYFESYWNFNQPAPILNTNYDIQRTLTNETWIPAKCLKSYLTTINNSITHLCGNQWTMYKSPSVVKTNFLNGKAISLSNNAYLQYQNGITLGGRSFTISGWFNMASNTGTWSRVFQLFTAAKSETNTIRIARNDTAQQLSFTFYNASLSSGVYNISYNTWYHFAFVYDHINSKVYIYINGKQIVSGNQTIPETNFTLYLGKSNYSSDGYFVGQIAEFMIYENIALYTENFAPPNQEDYFETYWNFNQPAPILNTNYNTLRYLMNNSQTWKYINPGYNDISPFTYTNSVITPVQPSNFYTDMQLSGGIDLNIDVYQDLWIKFDFRIGNIDETGTIFSFPYGKGTLSILLNKESTSSSYYLVTITHERNETNPIGQQLDQESSYTNYELGERGEDVSFIIHIKSDAYDKGEIQVFSQFWLTLENGRTQVDSTTGQFHLWKANINEGNILSKTLNVKCIYNLIVSNQQLTFDDMICSCINTIQRSIINNEEWRREKYYCHTYLPFDDSVTKDLSGDTWELTNTLDIQNNTCYFNGSGYLWKESHNLANKPFTVSFYMSATSNNTGKEPYIFQLFLARGFSVLQYRIGCKITTNGKLVFCRNFDDDRQNNFSLITSFSILDGKMHYIECVYTGSKCLFFVDGILIGTANSVIAHYNYGLYLGRNVETAIFTGYLDEFRIYQDYVLHTENFTPPVYHQINNKLYYDKSAETMKFESFADVQKVTWKIAETTSKKILVSYLPFDGDVKDLCDDERVIYIDGHTPVFSSQDSTKNKSLSLSNYDGGSYANRSYTAHFELLPYDKSWKFIAEFDIIANLPGDSFTAEAKYIDILKISSDSTMIVNILYWNPNYSYFSQTSNVAKLFIRNERNFSNPPDTFIDDYTLTAQSKKSFHVTIIFDNDELNPSTMIFLKPLDGGNVYIYRLIGDNILRDNKSYWIKFGGTYNATNGLNINIDEFKFYLDYNDSTPTTIIDKNIEVRFNNGEESVYFEFYANTTTAKSAYLNIFTTSNLLFWAAPRGISSDDRAIKLRGTQPSLFTDGVIKAAVSNSISSVISPDLNAKFAGPDLSIKKLEWDLSQLSVDPFDKITFTIWFSKIKEDIDEDLNYSVINLYAVYDEKYDPILCLIIKHDRIKILADDDLVDEIPIEFLNVYHLAITAVSNNISIYLNGKVVWYSSALGNHKYLLAIADDGYLETFGFGLYNTNIFENNNINIGSIVGSLPSYRIPIQTYKQQSSAIAIYHNDKTYYNKLVLPTDPNASSIRIYHNKTIYALSK